MAGRGSIHWPIVARAPTSRPERAALNCDRPSRKDFVVRTFLRFLLRVLYRFRAFNEEVLTTAGPVLLVPNHVSWLDWLFLGVCLDEDWKFVTSSVTAQLSWFHRWVMANRLTFPIDTNSPYAVKRMAEFLQSGGRLVLFAEGRITLTGSLMKIFDGTGFLLFKTHAKVITAYLRGANRVPWVRHKSWTQWLPEVSVHFSPVLLAPGFKEISTTEARQRLTTWLLDQMRRQQFEVELEHGPATPLAAIATAAARRPGVIVLEDASRQHLTYRRLMAAASLMAEQWQQLLPGERIGVLLPNANATPVTVLSLWAANKVPAILNFSIGTATMLTCAQLAGLKQVITSRAFEERAKLNLAPFRAAGIEVIYLEEIRGRIGRGAKLRALLVQTLNPKSKIQNPRSDTAVILFTSGSEGVPKGVELTHRNLRANVEQMISMIDIEDSDRMFNALPLFHSFGLTVGTLLPLIRGIYVFLYPSPLHYRLVPVAVYDRACTIMLGTNTFLNGYARKAHPYDFRSVRLLFAGAEKLQETTANVWARRFGVRILEGYGATECSPCISVNVPMQPCFGSAGRFMPGMEHKLEPVQGVSDGGRLFVRGPNVMRGYLNQEANAKFQALGGWYDTGDVVNVDTAGFVHILGRLKRFAKVSGEMVSLTAVEEALAGAFPEYGFRCEVAIISKPDPDRGEALVAVTNEPKLLLDQMRSILRAKGLSNLSVPREVRHLHEIPKLGTGKVNHRELEKII
jgi:acyl-[acyl-carrier-protein]-phospholipid O-acyltransferase/long-chain-fatty-acid--[acyl-carrier-protein] ligase